ncbi:ATP-grasp domain-containing protein [Halegenticoccus tardaugens]|uniref:ATP-grasp domain-containing protein n=1 Tax=Halegenticoccus tardaugens TaxID=2071624 RepID=UPI00100B7E45|nr:RimK family alpha-L-glutamate ligase [Halegenticoccus tardaugens]
MLRLAVATRAETFERVRGPLSERGIEVRHLGTDERMVPLTEPWPESFDVGFVFPPRPMEGGVADALLGIPWVNDREAVLTSRNKAGAIAALWRAGVPVPETTMVSNPADEDAVVEALSSLDFPVVVKPNSTTHGVGVAKASDLDAALGVADYLNLLHEYPATGDRSYLLQEFLPDARDYRAMVIDGECVGAVERRLPADALAEGRWKHNVHRGAAATPVDLPEEHRRLAERAAEVLDVPYLGVDLLESDGRIVVNETNARPTVDAAAKYDADFYERLAALVERTARRGDERTG